MKSFIVVCIISSLLMGGLVFAVDPPKDPCADSVLAFKTVENIQDFSVTIHAGNAQGSGEIKTRDGVCYVWTAGHVVAHLRTTRQIVDPSTGTNKTVIEFEDAKVVKELVENGRSVGKIYMDAEVIRYSDAENGEDLAVLRVRKKNFIKSSVQFYLDKEIPPVGTTLYHCGSLFGQFGSNSFTRGIMSQHGRVLYGKTYDQTTCAAFPGSSGGGVYIADGRMVGMITRGAGETFNFMVPVRRIADWAKKAKCDFALDDKVPVPTEEEIKRTPTDGTNAKPLEIKDSGEFPFKIKIIETPKQKIKLSLEW